MTVALAFAYFAKAKVDIAIIEVGLGGRLDSTNVITPELSVITNISFDHMAMLGDTLPQIAYEKAGIIKPNIPVIVGETQPESAPVFIEKATAQNAKITFADQRYSIHNQLDGYAFAKKGDSPFGKYFLDGGLGRGLFQAKNLVTVLQSIETLNQLGWAVTNVHLQAALLDLYKKVRFMGRWQKLGESPLIIADSGHNEAGVLSAIEQLKTLNYNHLHLITGFVNDKDVNKILELYPRDAIYYFAKANIPRGLDAAILQQNALEKGLKGKAYTSVKNALRAAKRNAQPNDLILVLGSIFVVGEVL
jgi:dihydrofolate synthase/folylpolyglutamate synthase